MAEGLRALCAQCQKPLCGPILASGCNHVFHKACFVAGASCHRCGETLREPLSLYNLCCEAESDYAADVMAAAAKLRALLGGRGMPEDVIFDSTFEANGGLPGGPSALEVSGEVEEVALLSLKRQKINSQREALESELSKLHESLERLENQRKKLRARQEHARKFQEWKDEKQKEIKKLNEEHEKMLAELNEVRQRDDIAKYWDMVRHGQEEAALQKLTPLISMVSQPWKLLSHMAQLRDHYRELADNHDRDRAQADRQLQHLNRERAELERTKRDLDRQLLKRKGSE